MAVPLPADPCSVSFGPFELNVAEQRLLREGRVVALNGRPFQVLAALAARPGRLVDKDDLLDAVWGHRHVTESVLKSAITSLRAALGDDAKAPLYIETVPRRGYRFIAVLPSATGRAVAQAALATPGPAALPGNLPGAPPGGLIGREVELARLGALQREHRLVTLTGLGGVGKTQLTLALAALEPPADGVWLLRLDDLNQAEQLLPSLAGLLRLGAGAAADLSALGRALRESSLRLVLDNAEHLVDGVAQLAAALLADAPRLRLLVTSQLPLRVKGEQVHAVAPLALPADLVDAAPPPQAYAAAQLFVARVRQRLGDWLPQPAEHADIAAICRALDGVPLAVELAAARVPLLGVAGVRERLDQRFTLLTQGARDGATRQRTLAAALDWTFNLLSPAEQGALQQLAVFAGSFTPDAAEAVLPPGRSGQPLPLDLVEALHERSLLVAESLPLRPTRLRLYDSVRRHALSRLSDEGGEPLARRQHLRWALQHFTQAEAREFTTPLLQWLPALRADTDSLRAALRFALQEACADAEVSDAGQRLLVASAGFWFRSGMRREGLAWLQRARALAASEDTALLLDHAQLLLVTYSGTGDLQEALRAGRRACEHLLARGDHQRAYLSLHAQLMLMLRVEPGVDRQAFIAQMQALVQPSWNELQLRYLHLVQALALRDAGDMAGYLAHCSQSAQGLRQLGATAEAWPNDMGQAQALALLGRLDEACEHLQRSVDEIRDSGALREQAPQVAMNAALHLWQGERSAWPLAREAVRVLQGEGMVWWMADGLAWAAWHEGRAQDALCLQAWADALVRERKETRGPVFARMRAQLVHGLIGRGLLKATDSEAASSAALAAVAPPRSEGLAIDLALSAGASAGMALAP